MKFLDHLVAANLMKNAARFERIGHQEDKLRIRAIGATQVSRITDTTDRPGRRTHPATTSASNRSWLTFGRDRKSSRSA